MFGFCTLLDAYGNIVAECDETALTGDILAEATTLVAEDGRVLDTERILIGA